MKRALVTGAAGLIGYALAERLAEDGVELVLVDDFRKGGYHDVEALARRHAPRVLVLAANLAVSMPRAENGFDTVFHMAAIVGVATVSARPWETIDVNLRSTLNVLAWAREDRPRAVLFASSSENYASGADAGTVPIPTPERVPLSIGDPELARWSYAASKIAGESALFAAAHDRFVPLVARFHNVYGPRMAATHVIPELLERFAQRADPMPVYGVEQTRSFLHVDDAARALVAIASNKDARGVYNVGSKDEIAIGELVRRIETVTGFRPWLDVRPAPAGSVARRVPDVSRLEALGFAPRVALDEGLRACWERVRQSRT